MFLLQYVAYAVLFLKSEDERVILFYLAQVVFLAVYLGLYKVFYPLRSRLLVNNMCMLLCIGFMILTRLDFDKAIRQFVIVAISALITWIIPVHKAIPGPSDALCLVHRVLLLGKVICQAVQSHLVVGDTPLNGGVLIVVDLGLGGVFALLCQHFPQGLEGTIQVGIH